MVKIEFDNVSTIMPDETSVEAVRRILAYLLTNAELMCDVPYEFDIWDDGRNLGTMTVNDKPPE